jgi:hypothetical protein
MAVGAAVPLSNCFTRSLLAMPWGPAGTDKAAAEQGLLCRRARPGGEPVIHGEYPSHVSYSCNISSCSA